MTARICFVCLGNICRSPSAEGVMSRLVADAGLGRAIELDSAGTGSWHVGRAPDERAQQAAAARGIDVSGLRARQVHVGDFVYFDLLVAMDRANLAALADLAPDVVARERVVLLGDFATTPPWVGTEVPDPYYGGPDGFDEVLDLLTDACTGLLDHVRRTWDL